MIQESLRKGKTVVVPKTDIKEKKLNLSTITCWDDLECGAYTIFEPKSERVKEVFLDSIDLLILPGVVFDEKGNRIGHGMGYYDRLLQNKFHGHVVGLAFELQMVDSIPAEKHDVRVKRIITEERIITCS
jgi:5-formyltetrahydrofolate cyclo-ligase